MYQSCHSCAVIHLATHRPQALHDAAIAGLCPLHCKYIILGISKLRSNIASTLLLPCKVVYSQTRARAHSS